MPCERDTFGEDRREKPIGVFDSGIGGLTVVREMRRALPAEDVLYLGDTARCPYGPRPLDQVRRFALAISRFLVGKGVKAIVVACNTASAAALEAIRDEFPDLPVIGVIEPGARAAVARTRTRRVGVIGTVGTIGSGSYQRALAALDPALEVMAGATPELVDYVERGEVTGPRVRAVVNAYLRPMVEWGMDTLILGCTHYPLLEQTFREVLGPDVALVSSAEETARELAATLGALGLARGGGREGTLRVMATNGSHVFLTLGRRFLGSDVVEVESVDPGIEEV